ncbi:MAG: hypothetical protein CNLJKLNK_00270 [Holosporales bacterium]
MTALGTRTGEEKNRPFLEKIPENIIVLPKNKIDDDASQNTSTIPDYQKNMLLKIQKEIKDFDPEEFLQNTEAAYAFIIKNFSQGNLEKLSKFTTPTVHETFCKTVAHLNEQELTQMCEIIDTLAVDVEKAEIDESDLFDRKAKITVTIKTKQINVVYNAAGDAVENPAKVSTTITDTWTFQRSILSPDPIWLLSNMKRSN